MERECPSCQEKGSLCKRPKDLVNFMIPFDEHPDLESGMLGEREEAKEEEDY